MGDRLVIWGNGSQTLGRYNAPKDVASAGKTCEGFIAFNFGAFVISLPGNTGFATTIPKSPINAGVFVSRYWFKEGCYFSYDINACPAYSSYPRRSIVIKNNSVGEFSFFRMGFCSAIFNGHTPNRGHFIQIARTTSPPPYDHEASGIPDATVFEPGWELVGDYQLISESDVWKIWTDEAPAPKYYPASSPPVMTGGEDAISLTFADNSTKQIPLESCPEWVQVKPANACPDGTVRQCDHGATTCCYGCDNGRLILIDSFNKSQ